MSHNISRDAAWINAVRLDLPQLCILSTMALCSRRPGCAHGDITVKCVDDDGPLASTTAPSPALIRPRRQTTHQSSPWQRTVICLRSWPCPETGIVNRCPFMTGQYGTPPAAPRMKPAVRALSVLVSAVTFAPCNLEILATKNFGLSSRCPYWPDSHIILVALDGSHSYRRAQHNRFQRIYTIWHPLSTDNSPCVSSTRCVSMTPQLRLLHFCSHLTVFWIGLIWYDMVQLLLPRSTGSVTVRAGAGLRAQSNQQP